MAFFEKVGETISTKGKEAAQKAKEVTDLARLNTQVGQLEGKIKTYYQIIGEKVYQNEKDQDHCGLEAEFDLINDAFAEIGKLKKQISDIKGTKECAECGREVANEYSFCPYCGAQFEESAEDVEVVPAEEAAADDVVEEEASEQAAEETEETAE